VTVVHFRTFNTMSSSIDTQLVKTAIAQLKKYGDSESTIEILAYCQSKDVKSNTEFLVMDTSTIPEGLSGDFVPHFFLLVNQDAQWKLINNFDDDELMDWVLENDKEIIVVSNQFYFLQDILKEIRL
jgi:hypothetical protein